GGGGGRGAGWRGGAPATGALTYSTQRRAGGNWAAATRCSPAGALRRPKPWSGSETRQAHAGSPASSVISPTAWAPPAPAAPRYAPWLAPPPRASASRRRSGPRGSRPG